MTADPTPADVAGRLADRFDEDGLRYALGGALALGAWGVPRSTSDVDVAVFVPETQLDDLERLLAVQNGRLDLAYVRRWLEQIVPPADVRLALLEDLAKRFAAKD